VVWGRLPLHLLQTAAEVAHATLLVGMWALGMGAILVLVLVGLVVVDFLGLVLLDTAPQPYGGGLHFLLVDIRLVPTILPVLGVVVQLMVVRAQEWVEVEVGTVEGLEAPGQRHNRNMVVVVARMTSMAWEKQPLGMMYGPLPSLGPRQALFPVVTTMGMDSFVWLLIIVLFVMLIVTAQIKPRSLARTARIATLAPSPWTSVSALPTPRGCL
jgi:hypothetical protein